jgi:hypothetical protein
MKAKTGSEEKKVKEAYIILMLCVNDVKYF